MNEAERRLIQKRHDKKFDDLMQERTEREGTMQNPKQTIWNFTSQQLSEEEESALRLGLKHGIANRPDDNEILASAESLWHQIKAKGLCRDGSNFHRRAKNQLRAMALNLINLEDKRFFKKQTFTLQAFKIKEIPF